MAVQRSNFLASSLYNPAPLMVSWISPIAGDHARLSLPMAHAVDFPSENGAAY